MTATEDDLRTIAVQFWDWWINKPNASDKESVDSLTALLAAAEQRGAERMRDSVIAALDDTRSRWMFRSVERDVVTDCMDTVGALSTAGGKP